MQKFLLLWICGMMYSLLAFPAWAQCPQPAFTIPDTVCINETFDIINNSTDAVRYEWDFCSGDLAETPTVTELVTVPGASIPTNLTTVFDGTNWFGFFFSRENNLLFRLDFGTSLDNTPTVVNVGNLGTAINKPEPIDFIKEGDNWYAFTANSFGNFNLVRLNFGTSLTNTPTTTDLSNFGGKLNRPRGLIIKKDRGKLVALITNAGDNTLILIDFGSSLTNTISENHILKTSPFPGSGLHLTSTSIIRDCDNWFGITVSVSSNSIFMLSFGQEIFSIPTVVNITPNLPLILSPFKVVLVNESVFYGFVSTDSGNMIRLNFGESMNNLSPVLTNLGGGPDLKDVASMCLTKTDTEWMALMISYISNKVHKFHFYHYLD